MGKCQLACMTENGLSKFSCDEVRENIDSWKANFRKKNRTDAIMKSGRIDRRYQEYCMQIDEFLSKCACNDIPLKCEKCSDEDHEGYFCRCEYRNIPLAKQLREKGMSPWQKKIADGQQGAR